MKLFRFGELEHEEPGVVGPGGEMIDVSDLFGDYDEGFFASGGLESLGSWLAGAELAGLRRVPDGVRLAAPVARPSKIVCVGKNYADHAREFDAEVPTEPILFLKAPTAYAGPEDELVLPPGSKHTDYEVELAVVIGKTAKEVPERLAEDHIAGYSVICDYSERVYQKDMGGQWTKGKSYDGFAPMGPVLVTRDELLDSTGLRIWSKVNGELRQCGYTRDMLFAVPYLISYISRFMTLLPGDVVCTGTPSGVGMGMEPPSFLRAGDRVELGCDEIGKFEHRIVAK